MPSRAATCATWATRCCSTIRSSRSRSGTASRRSAGRPTRRRSTAGWPRSRSCSRRSAGSRTCGRRRRTTSRPTSSARLAANGFEDVGDGLLLVARDAGPARAALLDRPLGPGLTLERLSGVTGAAADLAAEAIVSVLLAAFGVGEDRRPGVAGETRTSLADPRFTHYLVRRDGTPLAVARRATFDGVSYLSSIGTVDSARGLRARPVRHGRRRWSTRSTPAATGSTSGVFADNLPARRLYEGLGFLMSGDPGPDMIYVG